MMPPGLLPAGWAWCALDAIDVLDQHFTARQHAHHGAAPALVAARQHHYLIAFLDLFHNFYR
jgi:hypothetical protein